MSVQRPTPVIWRAMLVAGLLCPASGVNAQATIGTVTVSGSPAQMRITTAVAGQAPTSITNALTTYTAKASKANKPQKITGSINTAMPTGVTLTIQLAATSGATSNGAVILDAIAKDLVGNITNIVDETQTITYVLSATAAAGVVPAQSRIVTLTITAWP